MKKKAFLNIGCSLAAQFVTIISGLVIPRLMLMSFGSEANGLTEEFLKNKTVNIKIETNTEVESLNLASAVSICLYEIYN